MNIIYYFISYLHMSSADIKHCNFNWIEGTWHQLQLQIFCNYLAIFNKSVQWQCIMKWFFETISGNYQLLNTFCRASSLWFKFVFVRFFSNDVFVLASFFSFCLCYLRRFFGILPLIIDRKVFVSLLWWNFLIFFFIYS